MEEYHKNVMEILFTLFHVTRRDIQAHVTSSHFVKMAYCLWRWNSPKTIIGDRLEIELLAKKWQLLFVEILEIYFAKITVMGTQLTPTLIATQRAPGYLSHTYLFGICFTI